MKDPIFQLCGQVRETSFALHRHLRHEHVAQLLGYLRAARIEHGLLINFEAQKLEIRKYALSDAAVG